MRHPYSLMLALSTPVWAVACDPGPDEAVPPAIESAPAATIDTTPAGLVAVELPAAFPSTFPIPAASTITEAMTIPRAGGSTSTIALVTDGEPEELSAWYEAALADIGWDVTAVAVDDGARALSALLGESYVELTVTPFPNARADSMARIEARLWTTRP